MNTRAVAYRSLVVATCCCVILWLAARSTSAQIPLGSANFSTYTDGALMGQNGWQQFQLPATNPLQVSSGAVGWNLGTTTSDHQDAMLSFEQLVVPPLSGTTVITYDLLVNVAASRIGAPSYFAALNALTDSSTTSNFQNARLAVMGSGTGFVFVSRVNGQAGYPYRSGTTALSFNQDYALRAEIQQVAGNANDRINLYVGPDFNTLTLYGTSGYSSGVVADPTYGAMLLSQFSASNALGSAVSVKSMNASYSLTPQPAISRTWNGGSGTWSTDAAQWTGDPGTPWAASSGSGNVAVFNAPSLSVKIDETVSTNGLTFLQSAAIDGGTVALAANRGAMPFIATTIGVTGSVSSELAGSNGLLKTGRGTLDLTGSSSYTGVTSLAAGTLRLSGGPDRLAAGGILSFDGGGTQLDVTTTTQSFSTMTFPTPVSGTANIAMSGMGGAVIVSGTADFEVGPLNCTVAGIATSLSMASLSSFEYHSPLGAFRVGLKQTSTNSAAAGTSSVAMAQYNVITANNIGVAEVSGNNNGGGGELLLGVSNLLNVNRITQAGGRGDSAIRFQPGLTDPSLVIRGTTGTEPMETWLVGSNYQFWTAAKKDFTSTADLSAGKVDALVTNLIIGQADCNRAGRGGTQVSSFVMGSGTLAAGAITIGRIIGGGTYGVAGPFAAYGSLTIGRADALVSAENIYLAENTITGTGSASRIVSGTINLSAGTLLATNLRRGAQTGLASSVTTKMLWTGGTIGNRPGTDLLIDTLPLTIESGTAFFSADDGSITVNSASPLSGSGSLTKVGGGTLVLSASSSFSGPTCVAAGTLSLSGMASLASSSLTIAAGASLNVADIYDGTYVVPPTQTLAGAGLVVGGAQVAGGAALAPGAGSETLSFTGNLKLGSGGNYRWQTTSAPDFGIAGSSWDLLTVGGTLAVMSTPADPFRISVTTPSRNDSQGNEGGASFRRTRNYSWRIATATAGISDFHSEKFVVEDVAALGADDVASDYRNGSFAVAQSGDDLSLVFTASMFEVNVLSGTQTQAQAGFATLSGSLAALKTGAGTLVVDQPNALTGPILVEAGRLQVAHPFALASSQVVPLEEGVLTLSPRLHATVGGLAPLAGGLIDVGDGLITVASGLETHDVVTAILAGCGTGSWNGTTGITSSAAAVSVAAGIPRSIGWIENGDSSVTLGYAAPGDTNLDGQVDILDCLKLLSNDAFDKGTAVSWENGDFNYDGIFDMLDLIAFVSTGLYDAGPYRATADQDRSASVTPVPEPAGTMALLGGCGLCAIVFRQRALRAARK